MENPIYIYNTHQIYTCWQTCYTDFIRAMHGFHQLSKTITNLHFGSLNAIYPYSVPSRIGINRNALPQFLQPRSRKMRNKFSVSLNLKTIWILR